MITVGDIWDALLDAGVSNVKREQIEKMQAFIERRVSSRADATLQMKLERLAKSRELPGEIKVHYHPGSADKIGGYWISYVTPGVNANGQAT